ncbi:hypothetical protein ACO0SA_004465 [Hanseniaspora valbyensis]
MSLNSTITSNDNYMETFNDSFLIYTTVELNKTKIIFKNIAKNEIIGNLLLDSDIKLTCLEYNNNNNELALIGLNNGNLIVYSILDSKVINNFNISKQEISCLTKNKDNYVYCLDNENILYNVDYFTSEINRVKDLTMFVNNSNGNNEKITNLLSLENTNGNEFLLTTQSIKHINIEEENIINTFPGHLTYIKDIKLLVQNELSIFYTFSAEDKFINFYNLKEGGRLMLVLSCNENIREVKYKYDDSEENIKVITALTQEGKLEIFEKPFNNSDETDGSSSNKKRKKMNKISKKSDLQIKFQQLDSDLKILQLLINNANSNRLTLFYKDGRKTSDNIISEPFEYSYDLKDHYRLEKIDIKAVDLRTLGEFINQSDVASKKSYKERNNYVTQGDNFTTLEAQISEILNNESTTGDSGNTFGDIAVNSNHFNNYTNMGASKNNKNSVNSKKKMSNKKTHIVGTLTNILRQSLKSNDHTLLDQVLNTKDPQVIKMTLWKLPPTQAPDFLARLTEKVIANTNNSNNSSNNSIDLWLYYTLTIHGSYLMQFSKHMQLKSQLSNLYFIISKKAGFYNKLDKLRSIVENQLTRTYVFEEKEMSNENSNNDDYLIVDGEEYLDSDYEYDENLDIPEEQDEEDDDYYSADEEDEEDDVEGMELDGEEEDDFAIDKDMIPLETNQMSDLEMEE